ncbi:MAG TPA: RNA polymerase sigma factor [Acidimicrobiia bacterium]|nr:RNA polymerase sigma factor [Acidimicrobiia bacterium]
MQPEPPPGRRCTTGGAPPEGPGGRNITDDVELIERAKQGDVDAYGELVRRYQHDARRTAAAIGGVSLADDAAQEAFVRAFGFLHRFRPGAPFRPWLLTVVANVARNQTRSTHRWTRATRAPGERGIAATNAPSAEDVALTRRRDGTVRAALDTLPLRYRDVVACRYLLDLSEAETAQVLGIARGTVKSRLSRALDRLERQLDPEVHHA